MAPPGPVPVSSERSTPRSRANARTAGTAATRCEAAGMAGLASRPSDVSSPTTVPVSAGVPSSNSTSGAPTLTRSPGLASRRAIRPDCGDGISTTAFSVSTATSGWSSTTWSPSDTCQETSSASCNPSPRSGSAKIVTRKPSRGRPRRRCVRHSGDKSLRAAAMARRCQTRRRE